MKQWISKSILAGILIGLASCIYMSCANQYIGAFLFSIGLMSVIVLETKLFTGVIGYICSWKTCWKALLCLAINLVVAYLIGFIYRCCIFVPIQPVSERFINFVWYSVLLKACFTGSLIYLACELYIKTKKLLPIVLAVTAFILSSSPHCIADMVYLGATGFWSIRIPTYFILVITGNSVGSLLIRRFELLGHKDIKYSWEKKTKCKHLKNELKNQKHK